MPERPPDRCSDRPAHGQACARPAAFRRAAGLFMNEASIAAPGRHRQTPEQERPHANFA